MLNKPSCCFLQCGLIFISTFLADPTFEHNVLFPPCPFPTTFQDKSIYVMKLFLNISCVHRMAQLHFGGI